jgi:hypothetical protein
MVVGQSVVAFLAMLSLLLVVTSATLTPGTRVGSTAAHCSVWESHEAVPGIPWDPAGHVAQVLGVEAPVAGRTRSATAAELNGDPRPTRRLCMSLVRHPMETNALLWLSGRQESMSVPTENASNAVHNALEFSVCSFMERVGTQDALHIADRNPTGSYTFTAAEVQGLMYYLARTREFTQAQHLRDVNSRREIARLVTSCQKARQESEEDRNRIIARAVMMCLPSLLQLEIDAPEDMKWPIDKDTQCFVCQEEDAPMVRLKQNPLGFCECKRPVCWQCFLTDLLSRGKCIACNRCVDGRCGKCDICENSHAAAVRAEQQPDDDGPDEMDEMEDAGPAERGDDEDGQQAGSHLLPGD